MIMGIRMFRPKRRLLERTARRFPANTFLWAAGGSVVASLILRLMNRRDDALFVGEWAPTFVALGLFGKLGRFLRRV